MSFVTINKGGIDIADGVYAVTLTKVEGPKTINRADGTEAEIIDWTFEVMDGQYAGTEIQGTTSTSSGPKSKMYAWLTALFSGRAPAVGSSFEKDDLLGKLALATVRTPEGGWPKLDNLGAIPASMLANGIGKATGAPVAAAQVAAPVLAPVGAEAPTDDLPF